MNTPSADADTPLGRGEFTLYPEGRGRRREFPSFVKRALLLFSPLRGEGAGAKNNEHRLAQRASW